MIRRFASPYVSQAAFLYSHCSFHATRQTTHLTLAAHRLS